MSESSLYSLPPKRERIAPEGGWKSKTLYLVHVSYNSTNPIHEAYLEVGFLNNDKTPGSYSEVHSSSYDCSVPYVHTYYLRVLKELHTSTGR